MVAQRIAAGPGRPDRRAARPGLGLSVAGTQHAHAFARRTAAAAAGHPGALQSVRRRVRARRAFGRSASGRHRGSAGGARPIEGLRQFAVRRRTRARRDSSCRLDCRRGTSRRRTGGLRALQRSARRGSNKSKHLKPAVICSAHAHSRSHASRAPGLAAARAASRATTSISSTPTFRWACSPPSPACPARASRAWSARCWWNWWRSSWAMKCRPTRTKANELERPPCRLSAARSPAAWREIKRLVRVDQKPIGRTPRSNLATYTGLFDHVRKLFAATKAARARHYDAGRFSFNVAKGRCETCEGEGFVMVELLFLPSVYAPCPACHGLATTPRHWKSNIATRSIADVLGMTVDAAWEFFADEPQVQPLAGRAARSRPGLSAARSAGDGTFRRRGAADQAGHRVATHAARQDACTSSTSRRPACTRPTSSG